jgi:hypothetical protein
VDLPLSCISSRVPSTRWLKQIDLPTPHYNLDIDLLLSTITSAADRYPHRLPIAALPWADLPLPIQPITRD